MDLPKGKGKRGKRPIFRTFRQMGLKPGELPFKFRVNTDPEKDDETEITRKTALLRLNSQRVYLQLGCSAQALNSFRQTMRWLNTLVENTDEEDQKEIAPFLAIMQVALEGMKALSHNKTELAVQMEKEVETEHRRARLARIRLAKESAERAKKKRIASLAPSLGGPVPKA